MLMAEAFSNLLVVWDRGEIPAFPSTFIANSVLIYLYQVVVRILNSQNADGSWGSERSSEVTAYALLALCKASIIPHTAAIRPLIQQVMVAGRAFMLENAHREELTHTWVEKVTYGSVILRETYVLAALKMTDPENVPITLSSRVADLSPVTSLATIQDLSHLCFKSPIFATSDAWKLQAAYIESQLFSPYLNRLAEDVVPGIKHKSAFEAIPFAWTASNYAAKQPMSTSQLRQRIGASLLKVLMDQSGGLLGVGSEMDEIVSNTIQALELPVAGGEMTRLGFRQ